MRDVLFLQWCAVKGFRSPAVKGMLFLFLYYVTAFTIAATAVTIDTFSFRSSLAWFTPLGAFGNPELGTPLSIVVGVVLQIAISVYLVIAIRQRLAPSLSSSAASKALAS